MHALSDYPKTIQEFGTTDGYSTQNVSLFFKIFPQVFLFIETQGELEHCRCKCFYPRVHKGLFASGITQEVHHKTHTPLQGKKPWHCDTSPSQETKKNHSQLPFHTLFTV